MVRDKHNDVPQLEIKIWNGGSGKRCTLGDGAISNCLDQECPGAVRYLLLKLENFY
jgi:hypothetical protein